MPASKKITVEVIPAACSRAGEVATVVVEGPGIVDVLGVDAKRAAIEFATQEYRLVKPAIAGVVRNPYWVGIQGHELSRENFEKSSESERRSRIEYKVRGEV